MNLTNLNLKDLKEKHIPALYYIDKEISKSSSYTKFEDIIKNKETLCFSFSYDVFGWTGINNGHPVIDTGKFINLHTKLNNLLR